MNAREITVEIDELVLNGFSSSDGHQFASALSDTLARNLQTVAGSSALTMSDPSHISRAAVAPIEVDGGLSPRALGIRVAEAIGRRLLP